MPRRTTSAAKGRAASGARAKRTKARAPAKSAGVEAALAGLREEVGALARAVAALGGTRAGEPAPAGGDPLAGLRETADRLSAAAAELPRTEDFQPLADHLYAFAENAPPLMESLDAVRRSVAPLQDAAQRLAEVAETLAATHQGWSEAMLRLPRAEDYEPLAAPLREFARVSPALADTLASVVRAVTPMPALVQQVIGATEALRATAPRGAGGETRGALAEAVERMAAAREAIQAGLASLPRDPAYAKVGAQLRELATVSPSLAEWLREIPPLSMPLGAAIGALEQAAQDLADAEEAARKALG